jgi:uncharacterized protein YraI
LAVTVAATFGTLALGLAGTAAADNVGIYQVYGTGGYGLNVRTGPSPSAALIDTIPEGGNVAVHCQFYGDPVTDPATGVTSSFWDEIDDGNTSAWVTDLYVTTPGVGVISTTPCLTGV